MLELLGIFLLFVLINTVIVGGLTWLAHKLGMFNW